MNREQFLELMTGYQNPCVLGAAAELDVWTALGDERLSAGDIARRLGTDERATTMLLDAVAALGALQKQADLYETPAELRPVLRSDSPQSILPMVWHRMNIMRNWSQLAWVVRSGRPADRVTSIRGDEADRAAFIAAMHTVSGPLADGLVARLGPPEFKHLLDVGGASGTWTLAFLRARPGTTATIFDLPDAIGQARSRLAATEFAARVTLVAGDFYADPLPGGADFAWVSAIAHQHSRQHNRELYGKVFAALVPGGRIGIRDMVMEPSRTAPLDGAMFAINMLVNTETGGTFTLAEFAEDLQAAGFTDARLAVPGPGMSAVVTALKPLAA